MKSGDMTQQENRRTRSTPGKYSRWLWFVGLWLAGTTALLLAAYLLRGIMSAVGMST
ncbi:DUF2474 family protein [Advenella mimigardefordensis]|uniref:DUF2474 family protein n=1 Tax=Advenella mimigardefordensis TaxID=302406 RepID=UPI0004AFEFE2|nr:DUF2474 family protein [Advenella mimigardefordensis]